MSRSFLDCSADVQRDCLKSTNAAFDVHTLPALTFAVECGNMYTPSLMYGLMSVLAGGDGNWLVLHWWLLQATNSS